MAFSDEFIVKTISEQTIPVAVDCWTMKRSQTEAAKFYDGIVQQRLDLNEWTSQGWYVADHRGNLLGGWNNRQIDRNKIKLKNAMAKYEAPTKAEQRAARRAAVEPERSHPDDVVVLKVYGKILGEAEWPTVGLQSEINAYKDAIGRDVMWVRNDELAEIRQERIPESFSKRLFRAQLDDFTRGESSYWERANLTGFSQSVTKTDDGKFTLRFSGRLDSKDGKRWYAPEVLAFVEFDGRKLTRFDLVALGQAEGQGEYLELGPEGEFTLGIAMTLPKPDESLPPPQALKVGAHWYLGR